MSHLTEPSDVRHVEVERDHHEQVRQHRWRLLTAGLQRLALHALAEFGSKAQHSARPWGLACKDVPCASIGREPKCQADDEHQKHGDRFPTRVLAWLTSIITVRRVGWLESVLRSRASGCHVYMPLPIWRMNHRPGRHVAS